MSYLLYISRKDVYKRQTISNVKLNHSLSAGEYKAIIKISTSSLTDGTAMNGANVETTIVAK